MRNEQRLGVSCVGATWISRVEGNTTKNAKSSEASCSANVANWDEIYRVMIFPLAHMD